MKILLTFEIPDECSDLSDDKILRLLEGYKFFNSIKLIKLKRDTIYESKI